MATLYPLCLTPVYKNYIWGGDRIPSLFNRATDVSPCAESWEISDRAEGMSVVANGRLAGKSLHELVTEMGTDLVGTACAPCVRFPMLVKLIDARQRLSVQVHPDDKTARALGGEPKTEMWYALDLLPGAMVFAGLLPGTDRAAFEAALKRKQVESVLRPIVLKPRGAVYVPAGRVHAIGEGCLLLEIQQNSDTTYRICDWDRVGPDGASRPLHLEQGLQAANWNDHEDPLIRPREMDMSAPNKAREIVRTPFFCVAALELREHCACVNNGSSFHALFAAEGSVFVEGKGFSQRVSRGNSCLLPAAIGEYSLTPEAPCAEIIRASLR